MFSAKIRQLFLFRFTDFFITLISISSGITGVVCVLNNLSFFYLLFLIPFFAIFIKLTNQFFSCFFYYDKKVIRWKKGELLDNNGYYKKYIIHDDCNLTEYHKCDGSIVRFNHDGSFHKEYYPTFEKDNKTYFLYKNNYVQANNAKMVAKISKINSF